jgi:DUF218 domain
LNNTFFYQEQCQKLKFRYRLSLGITLSLLIGFFLFQSNAYLSKHAPYEAEILIVEGWLPDYALEEAIEIFKRGEYKKMITTGGPLWHGSYLKEYRDYSHLAKASLLAMGMKDEDVIAVPAPDVKRDRTFHSALALRRWILENDMQVKIMNLASLGPHTRRSTILFQKAFEDEVNIGSIAIEPEDYDPKKWYTSSEGVRSTINELIAYFYVLLLK